MYFSRTVATFIHPSHCLKLIKIDFRFEILTNATEQKYESIQWTVGIKRANHSGLCNLRLKCKVMIYSSTAGICEWRGTEMINLRVDLSQLRGASPSALRINGVNVLLHLWIDWCIIASNYWHDAMSHMNICLHVWLLFHSLLFGPPKPICASILISGVLFHTVNRRAIWEKLHLAITAPTNAFQFRFSTQDTSKSKGCCLQSHYVWFTNLFKIPLNFHLLLISALWTHPKSNYLSLSLARSPKRWTKWSMRNVYWQTLKVFPPENIAKRLRSQVRPRFHADETF